MRKRLLHIRWIFCMQVFVVTFISPVELCNGFFIWFLLLETYPTAILSENGSLQTVIRKETLFESYYIPVSEKVSSDSADFPLEPLLSNSSYDEGQDNTWTYFLLDIPRGAAGGSIHIQLTSDTKIKHEIYAKSGGLPSLQSWDYYYANRTNNSIGSMFFKLYNSSEEKVDFYILYVREGTWGFGIRHVNTSKSETVMSVSLERCPKRCSSHGQCRNAFDASGLTLYRFLFSVFPLV